MATFLLIHGAWHGAWCWERLIPLLEGAGHQVIAPDLPGMAGDPVPLGQASIESWAKFVADLVVAQQEPVVLVGHSRAGIVISRAAELVAPRLLGLVYLSAFLVGNGDTLEQVMRQMPEWPQFAAMLRVSADGKHSTLAPDAVERIFYNGSPKEFAARARERLRPEPLASFTTPLEVGARWESVPRFYIECARDRAISPELQRRMQSAHPCRRTIRMNSDHSPFYSAPAELTGHLGAIARELTAATEEPVRNGGDCQAFDPWR